MSVANQQHTSVFLLCSALIIGFGYLIVSTDLPVYPYYVLGGFCFFLVTFAVAERAGFHDEEGRGLRNTFAPAVNILLYWIAVGFAGQDAGLSVGFGAGLAVLLLLGYLALD